MPLLASLAPCQPTSFVVGSEIGGVVIYKIKNRKETFAVFQTALLSGRFFKVVVLYSEKRLINFLLKTKNLDWYKIETV